MATQTQLSLNSFADHSEKFEEPPDGPMTPLNEMDLSRFNVGDGLWYCVKVDNRLVTWEDVVDDSNGFSAMPVEIVGFADNHSMDDVLRVRTMNHWGWGCFDGITAEFHQLALERPSDSERKEDTSPGGESA